MLAFPGHFGIGFLFAWLTGLNPVPVIIGSVIPDLDVIPHLFGVGYRKTHRTITHSVFMPLFSLFFSVPVAIGVLLHLLVDAVTYPGIKLFYPFSQQEFYLIRGNFKKYQSPSEFIKDLFHKRWYLVLEFSFLVISLLFSFNN